jgi:cell division protein ZapA
VSQPKSVVRVTIAGEEFSLRSEASQEHAEAVAGYVDVAIRKVMQAGVNETQKAAILAALQITDELMTARENLAEITGYMQALSEEVSHWLPPAKRATPAASHATISSEKGSGARGR